MIAKRFRQLRKLCKVLGHANYRAALRRSGVAAAIEHEPLLRTLQFKTIVDIGANRGQFALVSRRCFPQARIIAFEPLAAPAHRFRAVLGQDPLVTLHPVAVGVTAGKATMHVAGEDDSSSLLPLTDLQQQLSGTHEVATEIIQIEPLAARIRAEELIAPALLKIDVQGYELAVLEGCEPLLERFSHIYAECSFVELYQGQPLATEIIDYLRSHKFDLAGAYSVQYDIQGRAIQADLLFARPAK